MIRNFLFGCLFFLLFTTLTIAQVNVVLPDTSIGSDQDLIVPIIVDTLDSYNVIALDFKLVYDSNLLTAEDTLLSNSLVKQFMFLQSNLSIPDTISFAGFGISGLTGGDTLIKILFHSTTNSGICPLTFSQFQFNEGEPTANITNGIVRVNLAPIPVELSSFVAEKHHNRIVLKWTTLSEKNNYGFFVQRAIRQNKTVPDAIETWQEIGFIEGKGTISERNDYQFVDNVENFSDCFLYYRLKQIDISASYKFSPVRQLYFAPTEFAVDQNYPNPFNSVTKIKFATPTEGKVKIQVYNVQGQKIFSVTEREKVTAGVHEITIDMKDFPAGVYFYEILFQGKKIFHQTNKMIYVK